MAFEDDVQGQNTQLYPVVVIDGNYYSTNNVVIDDNYCKPLLLNIPSIKESIDVESKKFKISSVSLDISNIEYQGERFTDQLSDNSLINVESIIYFKSHAELKEVYRGIIRRITHDDVKATVQLEDLTEKAFHRDLPSQIMDDTEGIQEKYRNKPKPMVYGHVDKSPVVLDVNNNIIIDYKELNNLNESTDFAGDDIPPVLINSNNRYVGVLEKIDADMGTLDDTAIQGVAPQTISEGDVQWNFDNNKVVFVKNAFTDNGILQCKGAFKSSGINLSRFVDEYGWDDNDLTDEQIEQLSDGIYDNQADVYLQSNRSITPSIYISILHKYTHFSLKINTDPNISDSLVSRVRKIALNNTELPIPSKVNSAYNNIAYVYPSQTELTGLYDGGVPNYGLSTTDGIGFDLTKLFRFGTTDYGSDYNPLPDTYDIDVTPYRAFSSNPTNLGSIAPHLRFFDYCGAGDQGNNRNFYQINFMIMSRLHLTQAEIDAGMTIDHGIVINGFFNEIDYSSIIDVEKVFSKNFYVNIKGRINIHQNHPVAMLRPAIWNYFLDNYTPNSADQRMIENPIDIIYDLVVSELGHNVIDEAEYLEARAEHSGWKFAFTQNKKINSKKLIEDIARSTKCFPRFNNDGSFTFNTIKDYYSIQEYIDATEITNADVISYSFKKTKPEQIYRKVDVQYNKDYEQNSYLNRLTKTNANNIDFYGIESVDDAYLEFESPYIRDYITANRLGGSLIGYYKHDHLIFNLKLPMKYISLNIGDKLKFRELLGGLAYGEDYRMWRITEYNAAKFPLFMITSITKNLDSVSVECIQLHYIGATYSDVGFESEWITGTQEGGLFYFPDADPITITPTIPEYEGEVLGDELWANDYSTNSNGWFPYNTNDVSFGDNAVICTGDGSSTNGMLAYLNSAVGDGYGSTTENLVEGLQYKLTCKAKVNTGRTVGLHINNLSSNRVDVSNAEYQEFTFYFTSTSVTGNYFRTQIVDDGDIIYIKDISLKEVIQEEVDNNLMTSGGTFDNPDDWTMVRLEIVESRLKINQEQMGNSPYNYGTAYDSTPINFTLSDEENIDGKFFSNETFDIKIVAEDVPSGNLMKLSSGNSQGYFNISGSWFELQNGINEFKGVRVVAPDTMQDAFGVVIFLHGYFGEGKLKSVSISPSTEAATTSGTSQADFDDMVEQREFYKKDDEIDLKFLKGI